MDWTASRLAEAAGISLSHASMILSGGRNPSLPVALRIFDATGLQFGILTGLDKQTIARLREQVAA